MSAHSNETQAKSAQMSTASLGMKMNEILHSVLWNPQDMNERMHVCMYVWANGVAYFSQLCGHIMLKVLSSFGTRVLIPVLKATHELLQHRTCARHPGSSGAASRGPCNVCSRFYSLPK